MVMESSTAEWTTRRRVFEAWSIEVPVLFDETFVRVGHYWHAFDEHRSVSMSSFVMTDANGPVPAAELAREMLPLLGAAPVAQPPAGLLGGAVMCDATESTRASHALSGVLAKEGRALLVTITSDDHDWARRVWSSIRAQPVDPRARTGSRSTDHR